VERIVDIEISEEAGVVLARIKGGVDISNIGEVRERLTGCVPNSALGLVVDLSATEYLDSCGIQALVELDAALKRHRQRIGIVAPEETASGRVLLLTGMDKVLPMAGSAAEAVRSVREDRRVDPEPAAS
jgi:anti-sigma B factor antagonist